jgi:hypothetical protein
MANIFTLILIRKLERQPFVNSNCFNKQFNKENNSIMHRFSFGLTLVGCLLASGCAANPSLRSQVDALQAESIKQNAEVKELSARAAKCSAGHVGTDLADDAKDMFSAVFAWSKQQVSDSYNVVSDRAAKCYQAGKGNVHTIDDAKSLALTCWNQGDQ